MKYRKPWGLNKKILFKSFIWYPLVVCVTTGVNCFSDEEDPELPDYDIKEIVAAWKEFVKDKEKQKKKKQTAAAAAAAEESFDYDLTGPRGTGPRCDCYYHCHFVNFLELRMIQASVNRGSRPGAKTSVQGNP